MQTDNKIYAFVGNRAFVYEEMINLNLNLPYVYAVANSYFEQYLSSQNIDYIRISNKQQLILELEKAKFDILITNGCPYILPVEHLTKSNTKRIYNIHPSLLPELRGADPIPGAILFNKPFGVTCHEMNDVIDGGDIIIQEEIENIEGVDVKLLYQLSFELEKNVFLKAYQIGFNSKSKQVKKPKHTYYTFNARDLEIDFTKPTKFIFNQIKAFANKSKGAYFSYKGSTYRVFDVELLPRGIFSKNLQLTKPNEIVYKIEDSVVIARGDEYLYLKRIKGDLDFLLKGNVL